MWSKACVFEPYYQLESPFTAKSDEGGGGGREGAGQE